MKEDKTEGGTQASLKQRTASGLLWGMMNSAVTQVLNVVFGVVLTFFLHPSDYGMIAVLSIYSAIAASLQDSGFVQALTNKPRATHRDYNSVFWFNVVVSAAIYVILWICAPLIADYNHDQRLVWLSRYAFLGFFLASFSITPRAILFKQMKVREQTICSFAAMILSGLVGIVMAMSGMAFWSIATQSIVFVSVISVMSWYFARWRPSFHISVQPVCQMFAFSCKLLITNIFLNINKFAFESILGHFYPKVELGYYSQANKWNLMGSQTISGMVQSVAQPMFVQVGADLERQRRVLTKMLQFTSFIAFPALFGLSLVSHQVISILPERWMPAAPYLQMLCIGGAFLPLATLYSNFIISRGKSAVYMWNTIAQSLLILLSIFVVRNFNLSLFGLSGIWLMILCCIVINVTWIGIWHIFVWADIRLGILHVVRAVVPFMAVAAVAMLITHYATAGIDSQMLRLVCRIPMAAAIYLGILRLSGAEILSECIGYLRHRKTE